MGSKKMPSSVLSEHSNKIIRRQVTEQFLRGQIERIKNKFQRKQHKVVHKDSKKANLNPYPEQLQHRSHLSSTNSNQFRTKIQLENPRIDETVNQGYRNMGFNVLSNRQSENASERQSQLERLYYNQAGEEQYKQLPNVNQRYDPIDEIKLHRQHYNPVADEVRHHRQQQYRSYDEVNQRQRYDHNNEKHYKPSRIRDEQDQYNFQEDQYKSGDLTGQDPKREEESVLFQKTMKVINAPLTKR